MKKTWMLIVLICLLTVIPASVFAEELQLSLRYQYMPSIKPIQGTNLILMESKLDNSLGLFTTDGQEVIPFGLYAVNKLDYGFLSVSRNKDELNGLAIYKQDGAQISDYLYGSVSVFDSRWVAGIVLENAPDKEKDITVNKINYLIVRLDLYFVSEDGASLIASLDRSQYKTSKIHGDYISIQDRENTVTAYDRNFQPVDVALKDVKEAYFQVKNNQIINNITNEVITEGYTAVEEAPVATRMLLVAAVSNMDGTTGQAILDTAGNVLMPAEYKVVTVGDPYVVVANEEGLRGLYSLDEQRLLVPCEFTAIYSSATSTDPYVNNGFVSVEKDGFRGYVDARTGEVSCEPAYNKRIAKVYGCSTVFDGEKGYVLIAGDGTRTELYDCEEIASSNGDGYLLVAKKNGFYGVIDWHGNEKLPFIHKNIITLTDDSNALIRTSTGMELDVITAR